ncbi:hypothetical protein [Psychrobacillus sp. BL-248-WT-3]|uniref:DUF7852 domain-containing protein n=1 Tax=Psychrobacillus sp. BL-248-WT-3 TaxID=2725306 RepID=UPI001469B7A6|nr:hypothetical protein [Psychrobacillus sp. BL-248-WT-3]NME05806.1 hypothetical protein [Psychrobacillus sp. BL-248-WT-3]
MGLIIPNIEDGVVFTKEEAVTFNIASDFHYNNSEGKLTVPWFDYGAFVEINNNQKKCICFSVSQLFESAEVKSDEEVFEDDSLTEIEEVYASDIKKVNRRTFKRKRRRRFIATVPSEDNIMINGPQENTKENSLFNFLREEKNSLKPYYLLSNNKKNIKQPNQLKYIRAYLPKPRRKINPVLEYENADYNHELEVMAYIESEEEPTEWNATEQTPLQDSSFFIEAQAIEIPSLQEDSKQGESIEETNMPTIPSYDSKEEMLVLGNDVDYSSIEIAHEIDPLDSITKELEIKNEDNIRFMEESLRDTYLSEMISSLKKIIASKEAGESDDFNTLPDNTHHQEENIPTIVKESLIEEEEILLTNLVAEEDSQNLEEVIYRVKGPTSNIKTKTIYIPFSTYVDIEDFMNPALYGSAKQEGYNFLPTNNDHFPLLDTVFFDSMYFFQEELYCHLLGYKVHEILFSAHNNDSQKLSVAENNLYKSQVKVRHNSGQKENKLPLAVHIKVPVIIGEYDVEISLKRALDLEERVVNIKELSKDIQLASCKFIPSSFEQSNEEGVQQATRGKLLIEGTIIQRIEYTVLSESEEKLRKKDLPSESPKVQQNAVIELVLQLLQVQKVYYPSTKK